MHMRFKTLFFIFFFALSSFFPTYSQAKKVKKKSDSSIDLALQYVGLGNEFNKDGLNWCADFVVFIYKEKLPVKPSRSAKALFNNFRNAGLTTHNPKPGDIIFFWRDSPKSWKGHVGIIKEVTETKIITVEGNIKDKVVIRMYNRGNIPRLLGFGKIT